MITLTKEMDQSSKMGQLIDAVEGLRELLDHPEDVRR